MKAAGVSDIFGPNKTRLLLPGTDAEVVDRNDVGDVHIFRDARYNATPFRISFARAVSNVGPADGTLPSGLVHCSILTRIRVHSPGHFSPASLQSLASAASHRGQGPSKIGVIFRHRFSLVVWTHTFGRCGDMTCGITPEWVPQPSSSRLCFVCCCVSCQPRSVAVRAGPAMVVIRASSRGSLRSGAQGEVGPRS